MENQHIVLERLFNVSVSKVWKAITVKNEMKKWSFDFAEFNAEVRLQFQFTGGPSPEKQYLHLCKITEVIPEEKLTYSWRYDGYAGISYVTFEIMTQGDKTPLRLTYKGIDTSPIENPDLAIGIFLTGWNHPLHTSLKEYLEPIQKSEEY